MSHHHYGGAPLLAGPATGRMRITAEAFGTSGSALNLATSMSVVVTDQGFTSLGNLGIISAAMTFVNPITGPDTRGHGWVWLRTVGSSAKQKKQVERDEEGCGCFA